jgi:hypothetical protein
MVSLIRYFVASLLIGFKCFLKSIQFFLGILHFGVHILFRGGLSFTGIGNPPPHNPQSTRTQTGSNYGYNFSGCGFEHGVFVRYINLIPFNFFSLSGALSFFHRFSEP